ncbi:Histone-lysine N-methyltransferase SETMAR, partial [Harpegnathos saltator]
KTCEYWFGRFKSEDFNVNDKDRSGQPRELENADLQALLDEDPAQSTSELTTALNVNRTIVTKRLHDTGKIHK